MKLSDELRGEYWRIVNQQRDVIAARTALAQIDTTVLCGDLLAHTNRSLGQIKRQSDARFARTRKACGMGNG